MTNKNAVADNAAEKYEVAPLALAMNESFISICLAFGPMPPLYSAYRTAQNLIQAIPPESSPLLQLPHITPVIAQKIQAQSQKTHLSIQQFMDMSEYQRRKIATDQPGVLTPTEYNDVVAVARQIPLVKVEKVFFKVVGERHITTGSLVQLVVKSRVIPPGTANVPEVNEIDLEDIDPDEGDLDGLLGRKPSKNSRIKDIDGKPTASDLDEKPIQPPLAYAPYFARDHSPRWHMLLSESKQNRVAVPPSTITTFNKPIFEDGGRPTFNIQTMKLQFQAPPQAGNFTFVMHLICDSYIGMDSKVEATLVVEDQAKAAEIASDDEEISEPDEGKKLQDSVVLYGTYTDIMMIGTLVGQMSSFKNGGLSEASAKRPKRRTTKENSSDDESDTEGEVIDTSETDTETDTDGE